MLFEGEVGGEMEGLLMRGREEVLGLLRTWCCCLFVCG